MIIMMELKHLEYIHIVLKQKEEQFIKSIGEKVFKEWTQEDKDVFDLWSVLEVIEASIEHIKNGDESNVTL